jgi:hypothetical protein
LVKATFAFEISGMTWKPIRKIVPGTRNFSGTVRCHGPR